jgi:hypothetical protein
MRVTLVSHAQFVGVAKYQEQASCALSLRSIATGKKEMAVKKLGQISILPVAITLQTGSPASGMKLEIKQSD